MILPSRRTLIALATAGSAAMLLGAFGFQYLGDMAPCKLCLWQRWPHAAAIVIGGLALALPRALLCYAGALAALCTSGIGLYHTGVERGWWDGPSSCSGTDVSGVSASELLDQIMTAPMVRCTDVPWEMLGLSMASWNMLASLGFALLWVMAARRAT